MIVAVATHAQGFDTFAGLLPAFAFHAVCSVAGLQVVRAGNRYGEARAAAAAEAQ